MPLQTAPFPIIFILIFFVLPVIVLFGIIVGVFWYFRHFKNRTKFLMTGVAVLLFYGLGMTYLAVAASSHNSYLVKVETCDQHKITGQTEDGKDITLYFPRLFGSGHSELGAGSAVKTVDQDGNWDSSYPTMICEDVLGMKGWFDTDGLRRIELVHFIENNGPLIYSLPDGIEIQKITDLSLSRDWFVDSEYPLPYPSINCS